MVSRRHITGFDLRRNSGPCRRSHLLQMKWRPGQAVGPAGPIALSAVSSPEGQLPELRGATARGPGRAPGGSPGNPHTLPAGDRPRNPGSAGPSQVLRPQVESPRLEDRVNPPRPSIREQAPVGQEAPDPLQAPRTLLESGGVSASAVLSVCRHSARPPCRQALPVPNLPGAGRDLSSSLASACEAPGSAAGGCGGVEATGRAGLAAVRGPVGAAAGQSWRKGPEQWGSQNQRARKTGAQKTPPPPYRLSRLPWTGQAGGLRRRLEVAGEGRQGPPPARGGSRAGAQAAAGASYPEQHRSPRGHRDLPGPCPSAPACMTSTHVPAEKAEANPPSSSAAKRGPARPALQAPETLAPGRHGRPPPPRRAAATSVQGMREPPSPGHPEEKAVPPGNSGHVGFPGAASALVPGAGSGQRGARLPARTQGPFLTTCDGYRACSTYRTLYRTAYRRHPGPAPARPRYACCPGWKRTGGVPGACGAAICQPPCQNGGSCVQPGRCHCPAGWQGDACQTDVDECSAGGGGCPQRCVNTAGSYWCQCWEGHRPSVDGAVCLPERGAPRVTPDPATGADSEVKEEVQRLQSRVDVLEEKLQLVLAPLHSLASRALEHGLPDPGSLLAHSLQQLDRIDSLSEQISFLEEQLGSCSCKKEV
ncbi:hypothetical protein AB1E19_009209 [Capra hircus]